MSIKRINTWSLGEWVASLALVFAVSVVAYHHYQVATTLPYEETVQVTDPVQLDKKEYKIGEPITGFFEGERYSNKPAIFNRTLVCADFRAILKPVRVESPPIGVFNRGAILLTLNNHIFAIENIPVTAQKSCEIIYAPQTVMRKYPLGGEELQQDQAFRTTTFDIVVE